MSTNLVISDCAAGVAEWDRFAQRCGASFRCAHGALALWQLDHHLPYRLRLLEIHAVRGGERRKIGQCAVGISLRRRVFADSLQLLPEEQQLWPEAMQAVLGRLGAGEYHYGSQWSLEAPREADLAAIPGVTVTAVEPITVHAVSFREWGSWEAYLRGLSSNARRNAKRAQEQFADLAVEIRQGRETLRRWPALQALKSMLAERKQLDFRLARHFLRFAMRLMALRQNNFLAVARGGGEDMAAFAGIDFGPNTYFLESGARDTRNGTGWHLMLTMLQRAYGRAPGGYFVMGAQYARDPADEGLHFSRRQCRAAFLPTSEVSFRYVAVMPSNVVPLQPLRADPVLPVEAEALIAARTG
ncbi:GNAT family N-acetyltransferase [Teichococcus aestuarii]|uniref:GNAT family N-acetyltransferase n=1 Tax=Teichococcus aestuarii TaxID=568898 RepID=UPI0011B26936|nr:GNAT family N-acetyltransferase [Pseudoroseomonas aestuarii]